MKKLLCQWIKSNHVMLVNSGSLIATTSVTSSLGVIYWWLAARRFPPEAVGIASASISTMLFLGTVCMLGLGTLLITELPRQPGNEVSLISTALVVAGLAGAVVGVLFAIMAPEVSIQFNPLRANAFNVIIFASGISLTSISLVLDQALIGILKGGLQLWRNTCFSIIKLVFLFIISILLTPKTGITIYAAWAIGAGISLILLLVPVIRNNRRFVKELFPQVKLLRKLGLSAIQHHLLNLTLQAPTLALPVLVTILLTARMNAWFYVSWMIASFLFMVPTALTTVLHAMNSANQSTLQRKSRVTIGLALITSLVVNCFLQFATKQVLGIFGTSYAMEASWCLRILSLAAFPLIIKNHYISFCRIQDRIIKAVFGMLPGGVFELVAAALGAHQGGLLGLSMGWVVAIFIEAIFMFPTVYRVVKPSKKVFKEESFCDTKEIWKVDTIKMTYILPNCTSLKEKNITCTDQNLMIIKKNISLRLQKKPLRTIHLEKLDLKDS